MNYKKRERSTNDDDYNGDVKRQCIRVDPSIFDDIERELTNAELQQNGEHPNPQILRGQNAAIIVKSTIAKIVAVRVYVNIRDNILSAKIVREPRYANISRSQ